MSVSTIANILVKRHQQFLLNRAKVFNDTKLKYPERESAECKISPRPISLFINFATNSH